MKTTEKVWEATKVQFLLRNSISGIYYARLYYGGKGTFKSLKTDVYSVAKARGQKYNKTLIFYVVRARLREWFYLFERLPGLLSLR
jgi:hypothetical protein